MKSYSSLLNVYVTRMAEFHPREPMVLTGQGEGYHLVTAEMGWNLALGLEASPSGGALSLHKPQGL